ncbi:DUF2509 family protein [Acerihabitans sp. TG2]|uniref:DUF2509 family protein n=1 Tax=Acerihabitans sp. TG2 TaxID=3096008 RepID=UPI002B225895|nr:DUF2509 family protein [Acerihabitans sp. TG2]MEA9392512.1 DUF2509 family protein [Acerihabitans sp. TG2]
MSSDTQQGSSTLAALVAVLLLGLAVLTAWQRRIEVSLTLIQDQARYMTAFHQAESALSWGLRQSWQGRLEQCLQPPGEGFRACLQVSTVSERWILRGESATVPGLPAPLCLYRLVSGRPLSTLARGRGDPPSGSPLALGAYYALVPLPGGWLDYPPG